MSQISGGVEPPETGP